MSITFHVATSFQALVMHKLKKLVRRGDSNAGGGDYRPRILIPQEINRYYNSRCWTFFYGGPI
jgi:hypothetical protein